MSGSVGCILVDDAFLSELVEAIGLDGVLEAMEHFRDEASVRVSAILHAVAAGTFPSLRREAHALAGAALTLGLAGLGAAAHALERQTEATEPDSESVATLRDLLDRSLREASQWEARQRTVKV
jgi:HPt (histidine-containing phosphotransfer) domain-containing protein